MQLSALGSNKGVKGENCGDLHSNACDYISGIPEANVSVEDASVRGVPRHNEEVQIQHNVEDDDWIPGQKLGSRQVETAALVADDVEAHGHEEGEERGGVDLKVGNCCVVLGLQACSVMAWHGISLTEIEGISCRRSKNHQDRQCPFNKVRPERSAEWLGRCPKAWPGQHSLSGSDVSSRLLVTMDNP